MMKEENFHFQKSSLCGKAHDVEKLTMWKSSASLGAWRFKEVGLNMEDVLDE